MLDALADIVVVIHLTFVAFVLLGGLLVLRWPRVAWVHLPAAAWGVWVEVAGWVCPLTPLENWLRRRAGTEGYASGFVEHYVVPVLYPAALTREIQWLLGAVVVAINAGVYILVLRKRSVTAIERERDDRPVEGRRRSRSTGQHDPPARGG